VKRITSSPTNNQKGEPMAKKPNYDFEKRQKELARKSKMEEKKQRKLAEKETPDDPGTGA
jgi:hypothetical protein